MAKVWLADYECRPRSEADELPDVCLVCGEDATDTVRRTFRWNPSWVWVFLLLGLLPVLLAVVLTTKTMAADCPVCRRHRGHWWKGNLLAAGCILGGFAAMAGGFVLMGATARPGQPDDSSGLFAFGGLLALLVGLIAAVVVSNRLVRPLQITADEVHLTNVSPAFVDAVKAKRRADRGDRPARD